MIPSVNKDVSCRSNTEVVDPRKPIEAGGRSSRTPLLLRHLNSKVRCRAPPSCVRGAIAGTNDVTPVQLSHSSLLTPQYYYYRPYY